MYLCGRFGLVFRLPLKQEILVGMVRRVPGQGLELKKKKKYLALDEMVRLEGKRTWLGWVRGVREPGWVL